MDTTKSPAPCPSLLRASATLEAALLMPIIFLTVFSALYLTFQVHSAAAMTANASEAAVMGTVPDLPAYPGVGQPKTSLKDTVSQREVEVTGPVISWLNPGGTQICRADYKKCHPVNLLRKQHSLKGELSHAGSGSTK
jgi:hypothetical protein